MEGTICKKDLWGILQILTGISRRGIPKRGLWDPLRGIFFKESVPKGYFVGLLCKIRFAWEPSPTYLKMILWNIPKRNIPTKF